MTKTSLFCGISPTMVSSSDRMYMFDISQRYSFGLRARSNIKRRAANCRHGRRSSECLRRAPGFFAQPFFQSVNAYVLPPWAFFFGELYEGQAFRHGPPDHLFTQEIEMGLPYRFNVAAEITVRTIQWRWRRADGESGSPMGPC